MHWMTRGKTIAQLIAELQSFENQDLPVELSVDDGATRHWVGCGSMLAAHPVLRN